MSDNSNLSKARNVKNDEFYTLLSDIEKECQYYKNHFKNKIIYLNCDDVNKSQFWVYFHLNFAKLGLKKLIATWKNGKKAEYWGGDDENISIFQLSELKGNGSFDSEECIELLTSSDIVVTNEPFSLARNFITLLMKYNKKFLIISNKNIITYKDIFPFIKNNQMWVGINKVKKFLQPDNTYKTFGNVGWFTNLKPNKDKDKLILSKYYNENDYDKYDNFEAININKIADIPINYKGIMGVPITLLDKDYADFEIVGKIDSGTITEYNIANPIINGKQIFKRIAIKRI